MPDDRQILVNDEAKTAFCFVPKSGCTTMKFAFFLALRKQLRHRSCVYGASGHVYVEPQVVCVEPQVVCVEPQVVCVWSLRSCVWSLDQVMCMCFRSCVCGASGHVYVEPQVKCSLRSCVCGASGQV